MKFPTVSPLKLFEPASGQLATAGSPVGIGSPMMFARSTGGDGNRGGGNGGNGGDDYGFPEDDPDDYSPPPSPRSRRAPSSSDDGGRQRTVQFQPEERYWTEYLRIALPVIGLLLMLGVFWYWAQSLISDDGDTTEPISTEQSLGQTDFPTTSAELTPTVAPPAATNPVQAQPTAAPTQAQSNVVPTEQPAGDNTAGTTPTEEPSTSTDEIAIGATVVVNDNDVNLRPDASTAGDAVAMLSDGDVLTVTDGPMTAEGYTWWQVETETGEVGWVVADFIDVDSGG